jgi:hypothetical protein
MSQRVARMRGVVGAGPVLCRCSFGLVSLDVISLAGVPIPASSRKLPPLSRPTETAAAVARGTVGTRSPDQTPRPPRPLPQRRSRIPQPIDWPPGYAARRRQQKLADASASRPDIPRQSADQRCRNGETARAKIAQAVSARVDVWTSDRKPFRRAPIGPSSRCLS